MRVNVQGMGDWSYGQMQEFAAAFNGMQRGGGMQGPGMMGGAGGGDWNGGGGGWPQGAGGGVSCAD